MIGLRRSADVVEANGKTSSFVFNKKDNNPGRCIDPTRILLLFVAGKRPKSI